ncbi:hypothetical protein [Mesorhizobium sp.]|uniref:hypothetical protein n=1 Tax=Mesorhizobium sp. TaxID=1871066 RepID=UPI000FE87E70|nr:hypothetical protein [Mesorhizobium sp.]RWO49229.1 MAG: hypothetical protein EOS13_23110 [Mesorhizobium sp.]
MAATGNAINIFQHVLVSGGKGQPKQIPQQVMDKLVESGLYDPIYLNSIEVLQLGSRLDVPPPLSDKQFGITIGNRIFLYDINEIEELPIGFWIEQLELSRLFAVYGVPEFGRAIEADPNGIDTLVDRKVAQTCKIISC